MSNKKLSYHRWTGHCTISVEILPTAAQLYKNTLKKACNR